MMRNVENNILKKVFKSWGIDDEEYQYFSGGKCSDLFINSKRTQILKIFKWIIPGCECAQVKKLFGEKFDFIEFLNLNNNQVVKYLSLTGDKFKILEQNNEFYISYFMEYIQEEPFIEDDDYLQSVAYLIKNFHEISKKYKKTISSDWIDDFNSIKNLCKDEEICLKLKEFYDKISLLDEKTIIHFDMSKYNIVKDKNSYKLIDLDTITKGFIEMDIANFFFSLYSLDFSKNKFLPRDILRNKIMVFLKIYKVNIERIELFLQYRRIFLYIINKYKLNNNNLALNTIRDNILSDKQII